MVKKCVSVLVMVKRSVCVCVGKIRCVSVQVTVK